MTTMDANGYNGLSLNDIGEMIKMEGKLIANQEFLNIEVSLYFIDGDVIEVWLDTISEDVLKLEHIWESKIDPFLKYLEVSTFN